MSCFQLLVGAIPLLCIAPNTAYNYRARVVHSFHFMKANPISIPQSVCYSKRHKLCRNVKFAKRAGMLQANSIRYISFRHYTCYPQSPHF